MTSTHAFQKGNLVSLRLDNFKGVRELFVEFTSTVNFLIAPNGHGKSSVLEAIALCLGSRMEESSDLVYEGEETATVQLIVFDKPTTTITVTIGKDNSRLYEHDGQQVQCSYIEKLARKYKIYIDNPFVSMMEHTAQKIMDVHPFDRLKFLLEVSPAGDASELNVDVKEITQRCEACIDLYQTFERRRNEFERYSNDFHIMEETERLKRLVMLMEEHVFIERYLVVIHSLEEQREIQKEAKIQASQAKAVHERRLVDVGEVTHEIDALEKLKESEFSEYRTLYNSMESVEQNCRRHEQNLRQALNQERALQNLAKNNNEQKKKELEDLILHLQNEIQALQHARERLRAEELQLQSETNNNAKASLNTLHDAFQDIKRQRQAYFTDIAQVQNACAQFRNWYESCKQLEEEQKGRSFMLFPAIAHIAINRLCLIPENDAKLILLQLFGNDIFTVYTQSFDVTARLSRSFRDFTSVTGIQTLHKQYFGKSYQDAYALAQNQLEEQRGINLRLRHLKPADVVSCSSMVVGNPIIIQQNMNRLQNVYYILYDQTHDEASMATEIDFIFENNPSVSAVVSRGKYYRALKYDGRYNGKQITPLDASKVENLLPLLRVMAPKEFRNLPDIERRYAQIELEYNQQEALLNNAKEASRIKEAKISELRARISRAAIEISEKNSQIQELEANVRTCRVVTLEELEACQDQLRAAREQLSAQFLRLIDDGQKAVRMQVECSGVLIEYKTLEIQLENAKMEAAHAKDDLDAQEQRLCEIEDAIAELNSSCTALAEQAKKHGIDEHSTPEELVMVLQRKIQQLPEEAGQAFQAEGNRSKEETLEFYKKKLALQIGRQSVNIEDEQRKMLLLYGKVASEYSYIRQQTQMVFHRFEEAKNVLESFIKSLNLEFTKNMQQFGVSGQLRLKTWKNNESACQKDYKHVLELLEQTLPQTELPQTPQELSALFMGFDFDFALLARVLRQFAPGVDLNTRFAAQEVLKSASLSGGEKSVASLCLACSMCGIPLRIIDEINQGMDEHFENCAHEMIKQIAGQVIVSSPKLSGKMCFEGVEHLNVIIIMRREIQ